MTNTPEHGSARSLVATILIYLLGAVLIGSAAAKFAEVPKVASQMAALGFDGGKLMLIASLELGSSVLFLIPRARALGLLLVSAYLGGAIATHIGHNHSPVQPAMVLALVWIAAWLRNARIFVSVSRPKADTKTLACDSH